MKLIQGLSIILLSLGSAFAQSGTSTQNLFIAGGTYGNISEIKAGTVNSVIVCSNVFNGWPDSIIFNSKNDLIIASGSGSQSIAYIPYGSNNPINISPDGLWYPSGVTIDTNDNIYVADYNANVIWKIDAVTKSGSVFCNSGINGPAGLAFDKNGNLFIANYNNTTVSKILCGTNVAISFCNSGLATPV